MLTVLVGCFHFVNTRDIRYLYTLRAKINCITNPLCRIVGYTPIIVSDKTGLNGFICLGEGCYDIIFSNWKCCFINMETLTFAPDYR